MASEDDKKGAAIARTIEQRLVWLASVLVTRALYPSAGTDGAAISADKLLKEYENRFPAIPADGPPV